MSIEDVIERLRKHNWLVEILDQGNGYRVTARCTSASEGLSVWAWDISLRNALEQVDRMTDDLS